MGHREKEDLAEARDIRDVGVWSVWVGLLPEEDRRMLERATMHYVGEEDTMILLFGNESLRLGEEGFSRVVDAIRSFYDANRQNWILAMKKLEAGIQPPLEVIMPRVIIEVAPPRASSH